MIWDLFNSHSKRHESSLSKEFRRRNGIYYTDMDLAYHLVSDLVIRFKKASNKPASEIRFLEPCVGTGSYVFSYVRKIMESYDKSNIARVVSNIYVADNDLDTLNVFKANFAKFLLQNYNYIIPERWFATNCFKALIYDLTADPSYICISKYFSGNKLDFDIVATNPPYKNFRAERRYYSLEIDYDRDRDTFKSISKASKSSHPYASNGSQNLYKIFIEEILQRYLGKGGVASLLVPRTILSDNGTYALRSLILDNYNLHKVTLIPEVSRWVTANQAMCCLLIEKNVSSPKLTIEEIDDDLKSVTQVKSNKEKIISISPNKSINLLSEYEYTVLSILADFPKIGEKEYVKNLRGELDISLNKDFINETDGIPLIRGRNVKPFLLKKYSDDGFVSKSFLTQSKKSGHVNRLRIACQQISNMSRSKRLFFCKVPPGYVLGNSVNFIVVEENDENISLGYLFALLNSNLFNWIFKVFSSNNHISNKEISSLPLITDPVFMRRVSCLGDELLKEVSLPTVEKVNMIVEEFISTKIALNEKGSGSISKVIQRMQSDLSLMKLKIPNEIKNFGPDNSRYFEILKSTLLNQADLPSDRMAIKGVIEKYEEIFNGKTLNWVHYKLSALDLEMIETIPPGGNWKQIREEVFLKSKRLQGIRKTGGRTTLYGRLSYENPSYTITTYFNRPGNGTYVHPTKNRVLTAREAARLQSFPDDFYFCGNKTQLLKQIGNAVPPILSYYIARAVKHHVPVSRSADLFCGAGGMSVGFNKAGIQAVMASDFEKSACATYKVNHPSTQVICGDVTSLDVQEKILNIANQHNIDIICGGPPCQGFSNAGKRFIDDPRNLLFKEFLHLSGKIRPKVIVMENVEGILSFNNGLTLEEINTSFLDIDYSVRAKKFNSFDFGVPQRRKRVIFIAIRNDLDCPPDRILDTLTRFQDDIASTNVNDAIGDFDEEVGFAKECSNPFYEKWIRAQF